MVKGLPPSTTPIDMSHVVYNERYGPKFAVKYTVDSNGQRVTNGEPRPAKHRLWWQFDRKNTQMYGGGAYGSFMERAYVWEKPNNMGDKLIRTTIDDLTFFVTDLLQQGTADHCGTIHGAGNRNAVFQCQQKNLSDNVMYSIGYVSPDVNNGAVNWIFTDTNVHSAYAAAPPMVTGQSYTPMSDDAVRDYTHYRYEQLFALNSGDKIIYRIKWNNLDPTKNLGFGLGVEYVHFFVTDLSSDGEYQGYNYMQASLNGNSFNDPSGPRYPFEYLTNDICYISGPTDELSGFGLIKDAGLTSSLGQDTWSVTIP